MQYTDDQLEKLWNDLADVPFDENDNDLVLANDCLVFEAGTEREEIWRWFDWHYSKGVHALMFPNKY